MHALSKPFELACTKAFGWQGLGKSTVFQLAFSVITFYRKIIEQGGLNLVDCYSDKVLEIFEGNEEWAQEGLKMFPQAMNMFEKKIDDSIFAELAIAGNDKMEDCAQGAKVPGRQLGSYLLHVCGSHSIGRIQICTLSDLL